MAADPLAPPSNCAVSSQSLAPIPPLPNTSNDIPPSSDDNDNLASQTVETGIQDQTSSLSVGLHRRSFADLDNVAARLLPVPSPTPHDGNPSQTSFVVPGSADVLSGVESDALSPEIARADVSIAADGSFVQTTSALAARELKKSYDRILGVGQGAQGVVRSPYAITAVKDEYGVQVFRISHRITRDIPVEDTTIPEPTTHTPGHAVGPRRRARLSVHDFLPSSMFKLATESTNLPRNTSNMNSASGSTPPANTMTSFHGRRKLRKSRSNSDLHLRATSSSPNAGGNDNPGHLSPPPRSESFSIEIRDELTAGADPFGQVLGWSSEIATDLVPSSRKTSKSLVSPAHEDAKQPEALSRVTGGAESPLSRRPSVSTSAALSGAPVEASGAPFGENVSYTAPLHQSDILLPSRSSQLREMQSFESGLTAKAGDDRGGMSGTPKPKSTASSGGEDGPFSGVKSQTRFSTSVFDVLQTYNGLPLPSALLAAPPTGATIKLSTTHSPNPKDDPRFVIWGEIQPEGTSRDDASVSQSSHTDLSASVSSIGSRKRSIARSSFVSGDAPQLAVKGEVGTQTVIIAATVERWIAQLTSELNYDELLNFLLTYRTYISPVDLCHLLICRFHWALEKPSSMQDDMVRRIVRARTFIAIRYWLLTFFREDFLPNAELRHLFTSWLNTLSKDSSLRNHPDSLSIVRKLKNVVRECKVAHSPRGPTIVERQLMDPKPPSNPSKNGVTQDTAQGTSGNQVNKKGGEQKSVDVDDSDVDLDFSPAPKPHFAEASNGDGDGDGDGVTSSPIPPSYQLLTPPTVLNPPSHGRSAATPSANIMLLSQPLSMTILGHVKSTKPGTDAPLAQTPTSLPVQHSAISRAFVNTIGKLGRWRRVLNARSSVSAPYCGDMSAFDLEPNATGDLLAVRGGVEEYLKMLNLSPPRPPGVEAPPSGVGTERDSQLPSRPPGLEPLAEGSGVSEEVQLSVPRPSSTPPDAPNVEGEAENVEPASGSLRRTRGSGDASIIESEVADEHDRSEPELAAPPPWAPEVVSLDEYDLSDSDSSSHAAPRVRRLPRRLPLRRDFQFVRLSVESVSSMGICSNSSLASSVRSESRRGSVASHYSTNSGGRPLLIGPVQQWQIELISDDEDEAGDAEAALRRLEGQIDLNRQREKDLKVGRWLKTASKGPNRDSVSSFHSGSQTLEVEAEEGEVDDSPDNEDVTVSVNSPVLDSAVTSPTNDLSKPSSTSSLEAGTGPACLTPVAAATPPGLGAERDRSGSVGSNQASVQSHPPSRPSSSADARRPSLLGRTSRPPQPPPAKFGASPVASGHRSFILMHRSETLAQQFAIIEAELFAKIKFEELISHQWGQSLEDVDVRDWVQFVKERAKLKHAAKGVLDAVSSAKLSSILALRARFDLLVNFTSSEILLTHASERVMIVEKFIRIAWKSYLHNNFSTLVSLMAGLQTRWVNQAMARQWHKVGIWEQRVFDDLKKFTSRPWEFKYLRDATAALIDARPLHVGMQSGTSAPETPGGSNALSRSRNSETHTGPSACVPFLGVYLAQLYEYERLPDFVDPTAPDKPVLIDGETGNLSAPAHPEVFFNLQSLPKDLVLEPLINVYKQRLIAGVVKSFVAGQHLATKIPFEVDQKCYQKCFRLRSLDSESMHSISKSVADQL